VKRFRNLFEDGGLAQNTLLDKKKKPMSTATAENSFQSVKEVAEIGDESSSTEASPNIVKKGGKTVIIKQLDQMKEAKEKTEYDYEGDMARGQLQSVINNAQRVHDMLEDNDNLPEWVQSKITLAEDYISTVANYMMSEVDEEVKDEYARKVDKYLKKKHNKEEVESIEEATSAAVRLQRALQREKEKRERNERAGAALLKPKQPVQKEEVELDEVSTKGYHSAAIKSRMSAAVKLMSTMGKDKEAKTKLDARNRGLKRLSDRTSAEMKKANSGPQKSTPSKTPTEAERRGYGQGRYMGDSVEVTDNQINEARPSQRHPLEGHEYHKKSDDALIHIAKDAHKAAEAMKNHNTDAENKYRDQANDSATVRHFRKTSGMPDWYKKKYGHMKEENISEDIKKGDYVKDTVHGHTHHVFDVKDNNLIVGRYHGPNSFGGTKNLHMSKAKKVEKPMKESFRPMDEPKYSLSIQARQKKADDANKPPFDGPYKKSTDIVTDKSGAKHGGMSIARHLARMAAKKQANVKESTEPLQESRKAEIVREAMKIAKEKKKANSEDKFIADPELNSKVIKTATQM